MKAKVSSTVAIDYSRIKPGFSEGTKSDGQVSPRTWNTSVTLGHVTIQ